MTVWSNRAVRCFVCPPNDPARRMRSALPAALLGPLAWSALAIVGTALVCLPHAAAQATPNQAGEIRALVPTSHIVRTGAPEEAAQRSAPIYWQDIVRTDRGGRVRIGLLDGSVVNVGSESSLRVVQHDPGAQQTDLELEYGRVRANAVRIARPGGRFQIRTPVTVAGVVGTGFGVFTAADFALVFCFVHEVRVRNADDTVPGEVLLHASQFTRVERGKAPTPAAPMSPEQSRDEEEATSIPAGSIEWSHAEISWPPAGCGEELTLQVRAWAKQPKDAGTGEVPVDSELITGTLLLGATSVAVEGGRATMAAPPGSPIPSGSFVPHSGAAIPAKIWSPIKMAEGEGWRSPRAVFIGSVFYVLGPLGVAARPEFSFAGHSATLLWSGSCGAGFLAPEIPGDRYDVTLAVSGRSVAHGLMNLVQVTYHVPSPPVIERGQESRFAIELRGLAGLDRLTQGRPMVTTILTNHTPAILGDLRSSTPGASGSGETITFRVSGRNLDGSGTARLECTGRGRQAGKFDLGVANNLDEVLQLPRTPLSANAPKR